MARCRVGGGGLQQRFGFMRLLSGLSRIVLCVGIAAAVPGCYAPPQSAVPKKEAAKPVRPSVKARPAKCEQPGRPGLTEGQKAALFQDFDDWQKQHDPETADNPVPPPSGAAKRVPGRACRVSGA